MKISPFAKLLSVLALVQFTHVLDFVIMMPLGIHLMRIFDITPSQFGLSVSAYTFSAGIFSLISAFFVDKFDRKKTLLTLYIGFIIGTLCCALAPSFHFLLLARVISGAFGGVSGATIMAIIGDAVPFEKRGMATGVVMSAFGISSVVGVPIGLYLASHLAWHAPFLMVVGVSILAWIWGLIALPNMRGHLAKAKEKSPLKEMQVIITQKNHLKAFSLTMLMMFSSFLVIPFISTYTVRNVGILETQLPYIYFTGGIFNLIVPTLIGRLSDKFGAHKLFVLASMFAVVPILVMTHLPPVPLGWVLVVSTLFMVSMSCRMIPGMALITSSTRPQYRGGFMNINSAVQQLSLGAASYLGGFLIGKTPDGALTHYGFVGCLSAGTLLLCVYVSGKVKVLDGKPPS